ncbi:transmembrane protease serine 9-like [Vespula pensylvanica]|nr:transmembrane protease serine 9-like [Vespula pensylvanica]
MNCHAIIPCKIMLLLFLHSCVYALPRVVLQKDRSTLSTTANVQMHVDGRNTGFSGLSIIDDMSYIDYDPSNKIPSKRPNVCNDCVCGIGRKTRIVGGNKTSVFEYPWLVSMSKQGIFYCAGSLITRRHILTAAHCLEGFETKSIKLVIADSDRTKLASTAIVRRIKSVTIHEEFHTYNFNNDIAIIEMDRPVSLDSIVRTACLPEDKAIDYTGAMATVVGWGRTGENKPVSDELRKVNVPILSQEECDQAGYQKNRLTDNMFCAGYLDGKRDACFGDSGGPLHVKGSYGHLEVIGIISWGRGCARPNFPGIYTKLNNYMGWLKDHLGNECVCPPPHSLRIYSKEYFVLRKMNFRLLKFKILILLLVMLKELYAKSFDLESSTLNKTQSNNRTGKFLFDELFGIDITGGADDDEKLRNCTCECGITNKENRIVGGRPTIPNRYPWIARLVYDGRFHCGASLINNDYVITAAHCVRNLKRSKIRVVLGDYDQYVNTDGVAIMRAVSSVIRHRNFDMNSYNHDVALLKLRKPVKFSKTVRPVCLPQAESDPAGKEGTVIGWGRTSEGGMLPGKVHEVQVPVWSLTQCRKMKYRANRITNNMICAGKGTQDSCQGDSGGPLLVHEGDRLEIAGIVSWGVGCGRPGYPGVYTRVTRYLNWINTNIKESCLCVN